MRRRAGVMLGLALLLALMVGPAHAQEDAWDVVLDLPSGNLSSATFATNDIVLAAGYGAIFRSEDGGRTWQTVHVSSKFLSGIDAAPGGQRGWATGIVGELLRTDDSGRTWTKVNAGTDINLGLVAALDADSVIVTGSGIGVSDAIVEPQPQTIRKSDDAGVTWRELDLDGYTATAMSFADAQHGWIAGRRCEPPPDSQFGCASRSAALFRTDDGGESWEKFSDDAQYRELAFVSPDDGWAIRNACIDFFQLDCPSAIVVTADGGETWTEVRVTPNTFGISQLAALDATTALATEAYCAQDGTNCVNRLIQTTNSGAMWIEGANDPDPQAYTTDLAIAPDGRALQALGEGGARYSDDRVAWQLATFPVTAGTGAFDFIDARTGWLSASKLLRTQDAGATWDVVGDLRPVALDFVSATEGWGTTFAYDYATGVQTVTIQHTADGGMSWTVQHQRTFGNYLELQAIDSRTAWAYSMYDGLLLHTRDGGLTWYEQDVPVDADGNQPGIVFVDARVGWLAEPVCGPQFTDCRYQIWRTANGGDSWTAAGTGPNAEGCTAALEAVDARHAWLGTCELQRTADGGVTWQDVSPGEYGVTGAPYFFSPTVGRAITPVCDENGCTDTLHRTSDGGLTWQSAAIPPTVSGYGTRYQFVSPERGWRLVQDGGGLFAVSRQRLYRFVGAGPDEVPPPVDVTPPDTGAGPRRDSEAVALLVVISSAGTLAFLAGLGLRRRQR